MNATRRQFLAASAVVPVGAVAGTQGELAFRMVDILAGANARQHPDAELLSAFHEANRLRDLMDGPTFGDEDIPDEVSRRYVEMVRKIAALPANTAEGVAAKLHTFTHEIQGSVYSYKAPEEDEGFFPKLIRTALEGAQNIAPMRTAV